MPEKLCVMTLKGYTKFERKLTCGLKNDIRNLVNFHASSGKSKNLHLACKDLDEKIYGRVMFHFNKEWCKVWRKTDCWFQNWHEKLGKFSLNHSKIQKFHFDGLYFSKLYEVWAKKYRGVMFHWTVMQNFNRPWPCGFKNVMRNSVNYHLRALKVWKIVHWWAHIQRNYVPWDWRVFQNLKENWLVA